MFDPIPNVFNLNSRIQEVLADGIERVQDALPANHFAAFAAGFSHSDIVELLIFNQLTGYVTTFLFVPFDEDISSVDSLEDAIESLEVDRRGHAVSALLNDIAPDGVVAVAHNFNFDTRELVFAIADTYEATVTEHTVFLLEDDWDDVELLARAFKPAAA